MTISCPRCGLTFETQATTNTRCRRCRTVVRVGRSARPATRPVDEIAIDEPTADEVARGLVVLAYLALAVLVIVVPKIVEVVRRRRADEGPTSAYDVPEGGEWPSQATPDDGATRAHTGPNSADVDPAA